MFEDSELHSYQIIQDYNIITCQHEVQTPSWQEKIDAQVGFKRVKDILDYHISAKALRKMYLRILRK